MKYFRPSLNRLGKAASLASLATGLAWGAAGIASAQILPTSPAPDPTCVVEPLEFDHWFANNQPGPNVPVSPADSITFQPDNNCRFYNWSEHMFLWLTSPATGAYSGSRVFNSSVFYQVRGGKMVKQTAGAPLNLALRAAQAGPDGLPVVIDTAGHLREFVAAPGKSGLTALRALGGQGPAGIASVEAGSGGKAVFLDAKGHSIKFTPKITAAMLPQKLGRLAPLGAPPSGKIALSSASARQQIANTLTAEHVLIEVSTAKGPVFVEAGTGIVDNLEPGQAGGNGVLISQQNSVIFYETLVNDVYAWYLTGRNTQGGIAPLYVANQPSTYGLFPTTAADLQAIEAFAGSHGGPSSFPDGNALAMEIKLSWVDATTLPNGGQGYITAQANVPVYTPNGKNTDWAPTGSHIIRVALVGVHVVGSANGHPEMIWSTFEHQGNTPLATYQYNSGGNAVTVPQTTTGSWLFSSNGAAGPYNTEVAQYCPAGSPAACPPGHIIASTTAGPAGIVATDILREKPWGVGSNGIPNQEDATPAAANTEIVSIDTNIRSQLTKAGASNDPRFNYLFIGSTWTFGGGEPNGSYPTDPKSDGSGADEIGSSLLLNSTMETFQQGADTTYQSGHNCFFCHSATGTDQQVKANTNVSHIFSSLSPLQ